MQISPDRRKIMFVGKFSLLVGKYSLGEDPPGGSSPGGSSPGGYPPGEDPPGEHRGFSPEMGPYL